jgi:hypothetical protein
MTDDDCRCIYRADQVEMPRTNVAQKDPEAREEIADFLFAALMKPLHHSVQQHRLDVDQALTTMTIAERIAIELEMTQRSRAVHSYDYDPLR